MPACENSNCTCHRVPTSKSGSHAAPIESQYPVAMLPLRWFLLGHKSLRWGLRRFREPPNPHPSSRMPAEWLPVVTQWLGIMVSSTPHLGRGKRNNGQELVNSEHLGKHRRL